MRSIQGAEGESCLTGEPSSTSEEHVSTVLFGVRHGVGLRIYIYEFGRILPRMVREECQEIVVHVVLVVAG
jgi:hypothetical protein